MRDSVSSECGNVRAIARREFLLRSARWLSGALGVALILCGGYGAYGIWRNRHLETQVTAFVARGDVSSAVLVARHLLQVDKDNVIASRAMADLAERSNRPEAVEWRKSVAALEPGIAENQFALASTALRFGQVDLAAHALNRLDETLRATARGHQLAAAIALAQRKTDAAEEHYAAALEQEPHNHQLRLNLASIRLASGKAGAADGAREQLRRLTDVAEMRPAALRALAADALARQDQSDAERWTALLVAEASSNFSDHLLRFEATRGTDAGAEAMANCQRQAASSAQLARQLITWMNRHDLAREALAWSNSLAPALRETQPVPLAIAESLSCARDWPALLEFVHEKNWGEQEPLRLAVESHAKRHALTDEQSSAEAGSLWRAAITAARGRADQLAAIAKLAEGWDYRAQAADAWWLIANGNAKAKEALVALQQLYKNGRDSRGLLRVAKRALELNPGDLVAANNCASLGLLLNGDAASHRLAAKLHDEHPENAIFAATYAFSLHLQGKTADALHVLERLKQKQLEQPALAAYYVMVLAESGNSQRALLFLPAAKQATLLPEEQQLLSNAARKLNASS